jgi:hypothetical protein
MAFSYGWIRSVGSGMSGRSARAEPPGSSGHESQGDNLIPVMTEHHCRDALNTGGPRECSTAYFKRL